MNVYVHVCCFLFPCVCVVVYILTAGQQYCTVRAEDDDQPASILPLGAGGNPWNHLDEGRVRVLYIVTCHLDEGRLLYIVTCCYICHLDEGLVRGYYSNILFYI